MICLRLSVPKMGSTKGYMRVCEGLCEGLQRVTWKVRECLLRAHIRGFTKGVKVSEGLCEDLGRIMWRVCERLFEVTD